MTFRRFASILLLPLLLPAAAARSAETALPEAAKAKLQKSYPGVVWTAVRPASPETGGGFFVEGRWAPPGETARSAQAIRIDVVVDENGRLLEDTRDVPAGELREVTRLLGARSQGAVVERASRTVTFRPRASLYEATINDRSSRRLVAIVVFERGPTTDWRQVGCAQGDLAPGERQGACWSLVSVPGTPSTRVIDIQPNEAGGRWRARAPIVPPPPPPARAPGNAPPGLPQNAAPGEAWCEVFVRAVTDPQGRVVRPERREWRRNPRCRGAVAAPAPGTASTPTPYQPPRNPPYQPPRNPYPPRPVQPPAVSCGGGKCG